MSKKSKCITSLVDNINVHYYSDFLEKHKADKYFNIFEDKLVYNNAEDSKVVVFGKEHEIPRKQLAYGLPGTYYKFAGNTVFAKSWNEPDIICKIIKNILHKVEIYSNKKFNFVLINRYEDGNQYIGHHRDDEKELGNDPTIVGVSFGAVRDVTFKTYKFIPNKMAESINLELGHGSIFVMKPPTNEFWTHSIPKRAGVKKVRISLTFRYLHMEKNK